MRLETLQVTGWEPAIEGMRAPLKSYDKYDSMTKNNKFIFGKKDYDLAKRLWQGGSEHRKWMRQIQVWAKISAPLFWWSEYDTYRIGTSANSESTMHTIGKRPLTLADFDSRLLNKEHTTNALQHLIDVLNQLIRGYNTPNLAQYVKNDMLVQIKGLLPTSFIQTRYVNLNYETIATMYRQRKNHKLPHWSEDFIGWAKSLPYSEFITGEFEE